MPLLDYVDPETADEETRELLETDADYYGRPSLFARAMANNPEVFATRTEYHRRLVTGGELETRTCELAYLAVSVENECSYCVASHSEKLVESVGLPESDVQALRDGDLSAFGERERAAIEFAQQTASDPKRVDDAHVEALREVGFDDAGIIRLLTVATAGIAANTIADALSLHPTDRDAAFSGYDDG